MMVLEYIKNNTKTTKGGHLFPSLLIHCFLNQYKMVGSVRHIDAMHSMKCNGIVMTELMPSSTVVWSASVNRDVWILGELVLRQAVRDLNLGT